MLDNFIRDSEVNLRKYLPKFLFSDPDFSALTDASSAEHERIRHKLIDAFDQFYIDSATWGLDNYESILGITTDKSKSYERRRNAILLKLQSHQTSTKEFMINLTKRYMTQGSVVDLIEYPQDYLFNLILQDGSILYSVDLIDALETYKPAHLAFKITIKQIISLTDADKICIGMLPVSIGRKHIDIGAPQDSNTELFAGAAMITAGKKKLDIGIPDSFNKNLFAGLITKRTGKIIIGGIK